MVFEDRRFADMGWTSFRLSVEFSSVSTFMGENPDFSNILQVPNGLDVDP
jgi:hypothetical protein